MEMAENLNANTSPHYPFHFTFLLYGIGATKYIHSFFIRTLKLRFDVLKSGSHKMFMLP